MYCSRCGEKLSLRFCENEGLIPFCNSCEAYMFPQFSIATSMVVINRTQDKILLAKHAEDQDFILFAGYVKKGESVEKTVPREIREELGLDVVKAKYMSSRYYEPKDILMLNFIVVVEENKPIKLNEEIGKQTGRGGIVAINEGVMNLYGGTIEGASRYRRANHSGCSSISTSSTSPGAIVDHLHPTRASSTYYSPASISCGFCASIR